MNFTAGNSSQSFVPIDPTVSLGVDITSILASLAVVGALAFTIKSFYRVRNSDKMRLLENVVTEIKNLDKDLGNIPLDAEHNMERDNARALLFNQLEWLGFLVNTNEIDYKKTKRFLGQAVIVLYENTFLQNTKEEKIKDVGYFPEFKELYRKLRECEDDKFEKRKGIF